MPQKFKLGDLTINAPGEGEYFLTDIGEGANALFQRQGTSLSRVGFDFPTDWQGRTIGQMQKNATSAALMKLGYSNEEAIKAAVSGSGGLSNIKEFNTGDYTTWLKNQGLSENVNTNVEDFVNKTKTYGGSNLYNFTPGTEGTTQPLSMTASGAMQIAGAKTSTPTPTTPTTAATSQGQLNIPFKAGLNPTQQSSITNLLLNKPVVKWNDTDIKNWEYATNNAPLPWKQSLPAPDISGQISEQQKADMAKQAETGQSVLTQEQQTQLQAKYPDADWQYINTGEQGKFYGPALESIANVSQAANNAGVDMKPDEILSYLGIPEISSEADLLAQVLDSPEFQLLKDKIDVSMGAAEGQKSIAEAQATAAKEALDAKYAADRKALEWKLADKGFSVAEGVGAGQVRAMLTDLAASRLETDRKTAALVLEYDEKVAGYEFSLASKIIDLVSDKITDAKNDRKEAIGWLNDMGLTINPMTGELAPTIAAQQLAFSKEKEATSQAEKAGELKTTFQTANGRNWMITYDKDGNIISKQDLGTAYKGTQGDDTSEDANVEFYVNRIEEGLDSEYVSDYVDEYDEVNWDKVPANLRVKVEQQVNANKSAKESATNRINALWAPYNL